MNFDNNEKWFTAKLTAYLKPNSVSVVNNAACHNVQLNPALATMDWFSDTRIPFSDRMCKRELYSVIKLRNPRSRTVKTDALLTEHGHCILRLPSRHPDFNPTEIMWDQLKIMSPERKLVSV
jgi:transposase